MQSGFIRETVLLQIALIICDILRNGRRIFGQAGSGFLGFTLGSFFRRNFFQIFSMFAGFEFLTLLSQEHPLIVVPAEIQVQTACDSGDIQEEYDRVSPGRKNKTEIIRSEEHGELYRHTIQCKYESAAFHTVIDKNEDQDYSQSDQDEIQYFKQALPDIGSLHDGQIIVDLFPCDRLVYKRIDSPVIDHLGNACLIRIAVCKGRGVVDPVGNTGSDRVVDRPFAAAYPLEEKIGDRREEEGREQGYDQLVDDQMIR